jgi:hypothetical protein
MLAQRTLADLERRPPQVVVVNQRLMGRLHAHPVLAWLEKNYVPALGRSPSDFFSVWTIPDPSLRSRLEEGLPP